MTDEATQTQGEGEIEATRQRVQSWLLAEGWQLTEKGHPDAHWLLEARDTAGRALVVGQRKGREVQVLLEGVVGIADAHRTGLEAISDRERSELFWTLRFTLLQLGVDFNGVQEPLERVMVGQRVYLDGMTRDSFLQRVSQVRNGVLAVIWTISRALNLSAPQEPLPGVN